jgi:hypothetical protein
MSGQFNFVSYRFAIGTSTLQKFKSNFNFFLRRLSVGAAENDMPAHIDHVTRPTQIKFKGKQILNVLVMPVER